MRPELDLSSSVKLYEEIRVRNIAAAKAARPTATTPAKTTSVQKSQSVPPPPEPSDSQTQTVQQPLTLQHVKSAETTQTDSPAPPAHSPQINGLLNAPPTPDTSGVDTFATGDDILAKKLKQLQFSTEKKQSKAQTSGPPSAQRTGPDFNATGKLVKIREARADISAPSSAVERSIRQAPLLAASIVAEHYKNLVPQYGLLGSLEEEDDTPDDSQLFLNTNVPFSAFICGVQGSGKSHTTSCILENAIIASSHLGHLESPVSTLVFSYGEWSSGGAGFNISESTFLGASHTGFPDHHVKKVTVLYSPSNPAIKRMYERLPNVQMLPFRLKAKTLDIGVLHTLMAVDEKSTMPLYMATVEAILRDIASKSADCSLDYLEFKRRLAKEKFDQTQTNMLKMRMNLLESFLDLDGTAPVPDFNQGEVTIIDLSDPFLTPSTACILFKLGLEQFLQSSAPGKMVVLDEAHKYMLNTSGAKILTDYLTRVIRLQRHQGARVVISTQEPTIATDLIALCSVIIMHRFTSPTWYAALKKHINAVEDDWNIMQRIEAFDTGEALVYSPNAVLGRHEDGSLIKATGKLMRVNVRNRVTLDGGASIMAV
ncbi:uncharacterized protein M421DRAFT_158285 [Didymella exigua CBS 183.55]|uniref:Uncharacterized protein n=1 Tax=Didymella exigua CBS 183.55 TaxID=1150837 RepID=A0A6A5RMG7_9PLEO|nr:uncharacterized protein M421DRAFT_158285 [Didymella exigua CBS 183.55]KAF1928308.1 hypothetical protein M421DRAFT_158285 [Didymella exigua CBS 183.55]